MLNCQNGGIESFELGHFEFQVQPLGLAAVYLFKGQEPFSSFMTKFLDDLIFVIFDHAIALAISLVNSHIMGFLNVGIAHGTGGCSDYSVHVE